MASLQSLTTEACLESKREKGFLHLARLNGEAIVNLASARHHQRRGLGGSIAGLCFWLLAFISTVISELRLEAGKALGRTFAVQAQG